MKCSECKEFIEVEQGCYKCKQDDNSAVSFWIRHEDDSVDMDIKDGDCLYYSKPKVAKYLVLTTRHKSMYGKGFALFWGCGDSEGGYNSDPRTAHRFTEEEAKRFDKSGDIAIPIDKLRLSEECETGLNPNIRCLVELGTINEIYNLKIKNY